MTQKNQKKKFRFKNQIEKFFIDKNKIALSPIALVHKNGLNASTADL
jgi:hypothetical protein